jgi:hypothetical protein
MLPESKGESGVLSKFTKIWWDKAHSSITALAETYVQWQDTAVW